MRRSNLNRTGTLLQHKKIRLVLILEVRRERERNEEPHTDFPFSNINIIWKYLRKEAQKPSHRKSLCIWGSLQQGCSSREQGRDGNIPEKACTAQEGDPFRINVTEKHRKGLCIQRIWFSSRLYSPKESNSIIVWSTEEIQYSVMRASAQLVPNSSWKTTPVEEVNPNNFSCLHGFKYNIGEGIANVVNNLGKEDRDKFFENQKENEKINFRVLPERGTQYLVHVSWPLVHTCSGQWSWWRNEPLLEPEPFHRWSGGKKERLNIQKIVPSLGSVERPSSWTEVCLFFKQELIGPTWQAKKSKPTSWSWRKKNKKEN